MAYVCASAHAHACAYVRGFTATVPGSRITSKVIGQKKLGRALVPDMALQKTEGYT